MFRARGARIDPVRVWVACAFVGVGLLAGVALPAGAVVGAWSAQGPEGGPMLAFAVDPASGSTLYAGTYGGLFKTTDGGESWAWTARDLAELWIAGVDVDPTDSETVYLATFEINRVYRSEDGGETWTPLVINVGKNVSIERVLVDPSNPMILYASGYNGLVKSTNGGASWALAESGLPNPDVQFLVLHPSSPAVLFAGTGDGLFKSTDRAATWSAVSGGLPPGELGALAIDPVTPMTMYAAGFAALYKTTDGGSSWTGAGSVARVGALVVDPSTPSTVYAGTVGGGLYRTTDAGASWFQVYGDGLGSQIYDVAIDPLDHSVAYAAGNARVAQSVDGGATWATLGDGPRTAIVFSLLLDSADPAKVYAGSLGGGVADFDQRLPTSVFTSEHFPDFRFGVTITSGGQVLPIRKEEECIPETLCVSGSLPGRSELFIRIVGPKPNGYLWPTLVKFSTSTLEIWITQVSTGITKYYKLEGAAPGTDDLPGYFDRTGFLPSS